MAFSARTVDLMRPASAIYLHNKSARIFAESFRRKASTTDVGARVTDTLAEALSTSHAGFLKKRGRFIKVRGGKVA